jgi:CO dehydrogenase maturation factor
MSTNKVSKLIAITGKGGVGKTTVSALLIKNLLATGKSPVLAIDADPNSCLDAALGVHVTETVGRAREEAKVASGTSANISKRELLRLKLEQALVEAKGFDLIAMGRPEGEGCY